MKGKFCRSMAGYSHSKGQWVETLTYVVLMHLQVQIYTWPDATLRELTDLVKEVQPAARRTTARLEFALIYPDKKGRNVMRVIGGAHSTRPGPDDIKTLKQLNFQVRCLQALPCRLPVHVPNSQSRATHDYTKGVALHHEVSRQASYLLWRTWVLL